MDRLYNSTGNHIANLSGDRLYAPTGNNIGRRFSIGIFVNIDGLYLGEVMAGDRLLRRLNSPYENINYGNAGYTGNIGNAGNPGNCGSIGVIPGFEDIDEIDLE